MKRLFGLIGYPLSHSFSKKYFDEKFVRERISDCCFELFSIEKIELLKDILQQQKGLEGLAVTIPYKKSVSGFLDEASAAVIQMNTCNCIRIKNGKLSGYNTDVTGFEASFKKLLQPHHHQALILGTGGAAAAVEFVLKKLSIPYQVVSRKKTADNRLVYEALTENIMQQYQIIINCTPLGTYPKVGEAPAIPYQFLSSKHYLFDLVYNPSETKFLQSGKERGAVIKNGYEMLVLQAEENWKIWNS